MEAQSGNQSRGGILSHLILSQNAFLVTTFLSFVPADQLAAIASFARKHNKNQMFFRIVVAKLFISTYLNRVDRSIFFLFYEEPQFRNIEDRTVNKVASCSYQFLAQAFDSFENILADFQQHFSFGESPGQLRQVVENLLFEPDMPLPPMKRETIGMYCQTAFQHFLALKRSPKDEMVEQWFDEELLELKEALEAQGANIVNQNCPGVRRQMETIRFRGWAVDNQTYKQHLIQNFPTHNLIVFLMALSSKLVQTFDMFVSSIDDPLMRFVEFNLRASIYRNIVLNLDEKFAFVFQQYDLIYADLFHTPPDVPQCNFYRGALSIWAQKMGGFHGDNKKVYSYITAKLRENSLLGHLSEKISRLPSVYSELRDEAELSGFSQVLKDQAYQETQGGLDLEGFLQSNPEVFEVLAKDYLEYSIDLSVNELNVHMCGHSQHSIASASIFKAAAGCFVQLSEDFYTDLIDKITKTIPVDLRVLTFRQLVKEDLNFLDQFIAKPMTISKLVTIANDLIKQLAETIQGKMGLDPSLLNQYLISWDFDEKDKLLAYFAAKGGFADNCSKSKEFFFNIQEKAQIEIPKGPSEEESEDSEGEHEVYDSGNESQ